MEATRIQAQTGGTSIQGFGVRLYPSLLKTQGRGEGKTLGIHRDIVENPYKTLGIHEEIVPSLLKSRFPGTGGKQSSFKKPPFEVVSLSRFPQ